MAPKDEPDRRPDINSASADELTDIDAIGRDVARAIVRFRDEHGRIGGPGDLMRVPGISEQAAQRIGRQVHFY